MNPLDHIPFGRRVLLTAIIIIVVLLLMWLFEVVSAHEKLMAQSESVITCADEDVRDELKKVSYESLDAAFRDRIVHLFGVWMRDDTQQPQRFLNGARLALRGYIQGRHIVTTWEPKPCPH